MKDYSFIVTSNPIDRTAAMVTQKGEHFKLTPQAHVIESRNPIPIRSADKNAEDFTGIIFGRFTVIGLSKDIKKRWVVKCVCGTYAVRRAKMIRKAREDDGCYECREMEYIKRIRADRLNNV